MPTYLLILQLRRARNIEIPRFHKRDDIRLPRSMGTSSGPQQSPTPSRECYKLPEKTHSCKYCPLSAARECSDSTRVYFTFLHFIRRIKALRNGWNKVLPKKKLMIGMPTYGRSFTLVDSTKFDIGAPASGGGAAGKYTGEAGSMSYYEVCDLLFLNNVYMYGK